MFGAILGLIGLGSGIKQSVKNSVNDDCAKNRAIENGKLYYTDHNFIIRSCISGKPVKIIQNKYGVADYYDPVTNEILTRGIEFDKRVAEEKEKARRRGDSYYFTPKTGYKTLDTDLPVIYNGSVYLKTPRYNLLYCRWTEGINDNNMICKNREQLYKTFRKCYIDNKDISFLKDEADRYGIKLFDEDIEYLKRKLKEDNPDFDSMPSWEETYSKNVNISEEYWF